MKPLLYAVILVLSVQPLLAQRRGMERRDPQAQLRQALEQAGVPLSPQQEEALRALREEQRQRFQEMREQGQPGQTPDSPGGRGSWRGGRLMEDFQNKLMDILTPQQQEVWRLRQAEQVRSRGGLPALRLTLQEAGVPLNLEQEEQLRAAFQEYNRQRRELRQEETPDPAQAKQVEDEHLAKIAKLLNAEQRRALIQSRRRSPAKPTNGT